MKKLVLKKLNIYRDLFRNKMFK